MNKRRLMFLAVSIFLLICPLTSFGDGVYLFPAYITGSITIASHQYSDVVSSAYVYASADGGFSANVPVQSDGSYTLTVNAPEGGSERTYTVYASIYLKSGVRFEPGARKTISVVKNNTYTQNFSWALATLTMDASYSNDDWTSLRAYFYSETYSLECYPSISKTGNHSLLIPANFTYKWSGGYAYPKDTSKYDKLTLDKKEFTASPGEIVNLTWTGAFPNLPLTGTISGTISYTPLPEGALNQHRLYSTKSVTVNQDGQFRIEGEPAGTSKMLYIYSNFNNNRQRLYWPYCYSNPNAPYGRFDLAAGGETVLNIAAVPAMIKGNLKLFGTKTISDVSSSPCVYAEGIYNTNSHGGGSYDYAINKSTGEYGLYLTPGSWNLSYIGNVGFQNSSSNPAEYLDTRFYYNDYNRTSNLNNPITVTGGGTYAGNDFTLGIGTVIIEFTSDDGSLVYSPQISGNMESYDSLGRLIKSCQIYGSGSSTPVKIGRASIIGPEGTYTAYTTAIVNGSTITFAPREVDIEAGATSEITIGGPSLTIESPTPELYTYDTAVTVCGTASGSNDITGITVNGQPVTYQSTGNLSEPFEVGFNVSVPISSGPNQIKVVVTNSLGKTASNTRYVYKDSGPPALTVAPAGGTSTGAQAIILHVTATDDNQISTITVNGASVDFTSANNPNDPHEVVVNKAYNLDVGTNVFTVIATDNCKRSTAVTNIITRTDQLLPNPSFDNDSSYWYCITQNGASAVAIRDTADYDTAPASFKIQSANNGNTYTDIQLFTNTFSLMNGRTYLLTFKAKSSAKFIIPSIKLNQAALPWADYANPYKNLTIPAGGWQNYAVIFTSTVTANDARLTFFLGDALPEGATFNIDTLSLKEIGVNPPPADELLPNPSFDIGAAKWSCSNDASAQADGSLDAVNYDTAPASYRVRCNVNGNGQNSIQLFTTPFCVTSGKTYQLTFKAKCSASFVVPSIRLMKGVSPGNNYAAPYPGLCITSVWESYTLTFTANTTAGDGRITFCLGDALPDGATFNIDSVSFKEI
ncbi:MAG TPA: carbohydrate binding domain-containing protein [Bacillota bacterium]|nr:carbohydrate binding domain-containing protein [Bacillota bacterium]